MKTLPPGATLGMLGGGQLGRMSILAGRRMGYRFQVLDPDPQGPAAQVADGVIAAPYGDIDALQRLARSVERMTVEFENIPADALAAVAAAGEVCPAPAVLSICQNRAREKEFLRRQGFPHAPCARVDSLPALQAAVATIGCPCVLKTADFGYDGKGQCRIDRPEDAAAAWRAHGDGPGIVEKWIHFSGEFSVICGRNGRGQETVFPVAENEHRQHILHLTRVPARISPGRAAEARELGLAIARALDLVGLIAVELFLTDAGWLVNELAPRPHNSGHFSFDACLTSQFEQHIRLVCNLPPGDTALLRPVAMINLLGDLWQRDGTPPDWSGLLADPAAKLHLYGKATARPGRKMGHFCVFGNDADAAATRASQHYDALAAHASRP
jgi:5-(carboxyamino)imidazole ribonucleotide synthase